MIFNSDAFTDPDGQDDFTYKLIYGKREELFINLVCFLFIFTVFIFFNFALYKITQE